MPAFEHPAWLYGLGLALLPWWLHGQRRVMWASVGSWPADAASRRIDIGLRLAASLGIAAAALSLAGGYLQGLPIERTGTGAHLAIVLDRSASMADGFASAQAKSEAAAQSMSAASAESKSEAAARLLDGFVRGRPLDLFGLVLFSTAPMQVLGLSSDHQALRAALRAAAMPGIGLTNVAAGLALSLAQFGEQPHTGSRVLLFVSDGAAHIDPRAQIELRRLFEEYRVQLYWVYLRSPGNDSPTRPPDPQAGPGAAPEYYLHSFFQDLGTPYRLFEADNPQALEAAINAVARLQNLPLRYLQAQPRRDLTPWCDAVALFCALLLLLARSLEIERWPRG